MINWWREDMYLDWMEITVVAVFILLSVIVMVYRQN